MYGLAPLQPEPEKDAVLAMTFTSSTARSAHDAGEQDVKLNDWPVPRLAYHHVGPRILLAMRLVDDKMQLQAAEISSAEFERLLFCRLSVHKRISYADRIKQLEEGKFNGFNSWKSRRGGPLEPKQ